MILGPISINNLMISINKDFAKIDAEISLENAIELYTELYNKLNYISYKHLTLSGAELPHIPSDTIKKLFNLNMPYCFELKLEERVKFPVEVIWDEEGN